MQTALYKWDWETAPRCLGAELSSRSSGRQGYRDSCLPREGQYPAIQREEPPESVFPKGCQELPASMFCGQKENAFYSAPDTIRYSTSIVTFIPHRDVQERYLLDFTTGEPKLWSS